LLERTLPKNGAISGEHVSESADMRGAKALVKESSRAKTAASAERFR